MERVNGMESVGVDRTELDAWSVKIRWTGWPCWHWRTGCYICGVVICIVHWPKSCPAWDIISASKTGWRVPWTVCSLLLVPGISVRKVRWIGAVSGRCDKASGAWKMTLVSFRVAPWFELWLRETETYWRANSTIEHLHSISIDLRPRSHRN